VVDKLIGVSPIKPVQASQQSKNSGLGATELTKNFGSFLNDAVSQLNNQQSQVDELNEQFVKGQLSDVHQLMIASEKASLGISLTVQVRNKIIESYQEIMRMQV
jgi:flagellar hook-basal body complex protein FliE